MFLHMEIVLRHHLLDIDQVLGQEEGVDVDGNAGVIGNLTVNGNTTLGNASSDTVTIPGILDTNGRADIDNIRIDGNTISAQNSDGSVDISGNGSGHINLNDDVDIAGSLDLEGEDSRDGLHRVWQVW